MAQRAVNRRTMAAAIMIQRLRQGRGKADTRALVAALRHKGFQARYLGVGARVIRDLYGDNALVVEHRGNGQSPLYVLDPKKYQDARKWAVKMFKRALTETGHVIHVLDWSVTQGIAVTSATRAKHYAKNVEVELQNVLATI